MSLQVDIKKKIKGFTLEVSFLAPKGCMGILGASGCGKSMTLKAIAGIDNPQSGRIQLDETIFFDSLKKINQSPQQRRTGFLFQNYALFPNMTVKENILSGLGVKNQENLYKAEEAIERFHLTGLEKRYPKGLSGGQQQRAALARILVCSPQILLLDEPFSALDAYLKEELQFELREQLKTFNGTTILVTHDRDEAYKLCDRILIMEEGKSISYHETKKIFQLPETYQAARLTGCKNISPARKMNDHRIQALDWNMEFDIKETIPDTLRYVGIRAHNFTPAKEKLPDGRIYFKVQKAEIVEGPFEENMIFEIFGNKKLWWKMQMKKPGETQTQPHFLAVEPQNILLLK
ncbi:MAG: ATP-binding cassette domain-containing protein [Acetivibrio sp.]